MINFVWPNDCSSLLPQMSDIGLEMTFILTSSLAPDIERVIKENREYQLDAIKLRATVSNIAKIEYNYVPW